MVDQIGQFDLIYLCDLIDLTESTDLIISDLSILGFDPFHLTHVFIKMNLIHPIDLFDLTDLTDLFDPIYPIKST